MKIRKDSSSSRSGLREASEIKQQGPRVIIVEKDNSEEKSIRHIPGGSRRYGLCGKMGDLGERRKRKREVGREKEEVEDEEEGGGREEMRKEERREERGWSNRTNRQ